LIRKFIKEIIYSKENIKIAFYYEKNLKSFLAIKSPVQHQILVLDRAEMLFVKMENLKLQDKF